MSDIVIGIGLIVVIEIVGFFIFKLLSRWNSTQEVKNKIDFRSVIKGISERGFLTFAMVNALPQALTVFAALKIATRIKDDNKVSNDFYLMGNLLSIIMAIVYSQIIDRFF